ncbi:MAG: hypothetical protein P8Z75_03795 [Gammaproteobacteria bacterium]|jgi:predicted transcriptional regulator
MTLLTHTISIPVWLFLLMLAAMLPLLVKLLSLLYQFRRGDIIKEEQSDMVVYKIRNQRRPAIPKQSSASVDEQKKQEEKTHLIQMLKVLLKEGDKGVRPQTIADQLSLSLSRVQTAMATLIDKNMVEEVSGMSGTRYYLTQTGKDYCRSKTR